MGTKAFEASTVSRVIEHLEEAHDVIDLLTDLCTHGSPKQTTVTLSVNGLFAVLSSSRDRIQSALHTLRHP